jgi:hypothetical protein
MGERLIGTNEAEFVEATEKAPLRSVFYMKALEKALKQVAPENRSTAHDEYVRRVEYVKREVIPKAVDKLHNILETADRWDQQTARNILFNLEQEDMMPKVFVEQGQSAATDTALPVR